MAHRPPDSLTMSSDLSDAGSGIVVQESYREIKCCFSVTIRRDAWGVPVAIMGQWIVRLPYLLWVVADLTADMTNVNELLVVSLRWSMSA
jgi:hypothetical protein